MLCFEIYHKHCVYEQTGTTSTKSNSFYLDPNFKISDFEMAVFPLPSNSSGIASFQVGPDNGTSAKQKLISARSFQSDMYFGSIFRALAKYWRLAEIHSTTLPLKHCSKKFLACLYKVSEIPFKAGT